MNGGHRVYCDGECRRIDDLVRRIDLSGFPVAIRLSVLCPSQLFIPPPERPHLAALIDITMHVRHRDTGALIDVETSVRVATKLQDCDVLRLIKFKVLEVVAHELLEYFLFNGERIFDPHAVPA